MKTILLTQGLYAEVLDEDFPFLSQWKWYAVEGRHTFYAVRNAPMIAGKRGSPILMHRMIMNAASGVIIDHRDGNGLHNWRDNLRAVTNRQNLQNLHVAKKSIYPGVVRDASCNNRWYAHIRINGRRIRLGRFGSEKAAFVAYCEELARIGEPLPDIALEGIK